MIKGFIKSMSMHSKATVVERIRLDDRGFSIERNRVLKVTWLLLSNITI